MMNDKIDNTLSNMLSYIGFSNTFSNSRDFYEDIINITDTNTNSIYGGNPAIDNLKTYLDEVKDKSDQDVFKVSKEYREELLNEISNKATSLDKSIKNAIKNTNSIISSISNRSNEGYEGIMNDVKNIFQKNLDFLNSVQSLDTVNGTISKINKKTGGDERGDESSSILNELNLYGLLGLANAQVGELNNLLNNHMGVKGGKLETMLSFFKSDNNTEKLLSNMFEQFDSDSLEISPIIKNLIAKKGGKMMSSTLRETSGITRGEKTRIFIGILKSLNNIIKKLSSEILEITNVISENDYVFNEILEKYSRKLYIFRTFRSKNIYFSLIGYYSDIRSKYIREDFISKINYLISYSDNTPELSSIKQIATISSTLKEFIKTLSEVSGQFIKRFGGLEPGYRSLDDINLVDIPDLTDINNKLLRNIINVLYFIRLKNLEYYSKKFDLGEPLNYEKMIGKSIGEEIEKVEEDYRKLLNGLSKIEDKLDTPKIVEIKETDEPIRLNYPLVIYYKKPDINLNKYELTNQNILRGDNRLLNDNANYNIPSGTNNSIYLLKNIFLQIPQSLENLDNENNRIGVRDLLAWGKNKKNRDGELEWISDPRASNNETPEPMRGLELKDMITNYKEFLKLYYESYIELLKAAQGLDQYLAKFTGILKKTPEKIDKIDALLNNVNIASTLNNRSNIVDLLIDTYDPNRNYFLNTNDVRLRNTLHTNLAAPGGAPFLPFYGTNPNLAIQNPVVSNCDLMPIVDLHKNRVPSKQVFPYTVRYDWTPGAGFVPGLRQREAFNLFNTPDLVARIAPAINAARDNTDFILASFFTSPWVGAFVPFAGFPAYPGGMARVTVSMETAPINGISYTQLNHHLFEVEGDGVRRDGNDIRVRDSVIPLRYKSPINKLLLPKEFYKNNLLVKNIFSIFFNLLKEVQEDKETYMNPKSIVNAVINYLSHGIYKFSWVEPSSGFKNTDTIFMRNAISNNDSPFLTAYRNSGYTNDNLSIFNYDYSKMNLIDTNVRVELINTNDVDFNNFPEVMETIHGRGNNLVMQMIKSVIAKTLTVLGIYDIRDFKNNQPFRTNIMDPSRIVLGGNENIIINDDLIELYIRLPLLVEFYRDIFLQPFLSNQNDPTLTNYLTLVPNLAKPFNNLFMHIFLYYRNRSVIDYNEKEFITIIKDINEIYEYYQKQIDKKELMVKFIVHKMIEEVNKKYGILNTYEYDDFIRKSYEYLNLGDFDEQRRLQNLDFFDLVDEDLLVDIDKKQSNIPSEKFYKSKLDEINSYEKPLDIRKDINTLKNFRQRLYHYLIESGKDETFAQEYEVHSFLFGLEESIENIKNKLKNQPEREKISELHNLITNQYNLTRLDRKQAFVLFDFIVNSLTQIKQIIEFVNLLRIRFCHLRTETSDWVVLEPVLNDDNADYPSLEFRQLINERRILMEGTIPGMSNLVGIAHLTEKIPGNPLGALNDFRVIDQNHVQSTQNIAVAAAFPYPPAAGPPAPGVALPPIPANANLGGNMDNSPSEVMLYNYSKLRQSTFSLLRKLLFHPHLYKTLIVGNHVKIDFTRVDKLIEDQLAHINNLFNKIKLIIKDENRENMIFDYIGNITLLYDNVFRSLPNGTRHTIYDSVPHIENFLNLTRDYIREDMLFANTLATSYNFVSVLVENNGETFNNMGRETTIGFRYSNTSLTPVINNVRTSWRNMAINFWNEFMPMRNHFYGYELVNTLKAQSIPLEYRIEYNGPRENDNFFNLEHSLVLEPYDSIFNGSGMFGYDIITYLNFIILTIIKNCSSKTDKKIYKGCLDFMHHIDLSYDEYINNTITRVNSISYIPNGIDFSGRLGQRGINIFNPMFTSTNYLLKLNVGRNSLLDYSVNDFNTFPPTMSFHPRKINLGRGINGNNFSIKIGYGTDLVENVNGFLAKIHTIEYPPSALGEENIFNTTGGDNASNRFTSSLFLYVVEENPYENIFFSPFPRAARVPDPLPLLPCSRQVCFSAKQNYDIVGFGEGLGYDYNGSFQLTAIATLVNERTSCFNSVLPPNPYENSGSAASSNRSKIDINFRTQIGHNFVAFEAHPSLHPNAILLKSVANMLKNIPVNNKRGTELLNLYNNIIEIPESDRQNVETIMYFVKYHCEILLSLTKIMQININFNNQNNIIDRVARTTIAIMKTCNTVIDELGDSPFKYGEKYYGYLDSLKKIYKTTPNIGVSTYLNQYSVDYFPYDTVISRNTHQLVTPILNPFNVSRFINDDNNALLNRTFQGVPNILPYALYSMSKLLYNRLSLKLVIYINNNGNIEHILSYPDHESRNELYILSNMFRTEEIFTVGDHGFITAGTALAGTYPPVFYDNNPTVPPPNAQPTAIVPPFTVPINYPVALPVALTYAHLGAPPGIPASRLKRVVEIKTGDDQFKNQIQEVIQKQHNVAAPNANTIYYISYQFTPVSTDYKGGAVPNITPGIPGIAPPGIPVGAFPALPGGVLGIGDLFYPVSGPAPWIPRREFMSMLRNFYNQFDTIYLNVDPALPAPNDVHYPEFSNSFIINNYTLNCNFFTPFCFFRLFDMVAHSNPLNTISEYLTYNRKIYGQKRITVNGDDYFINQDVYLLATYPYFASGATAGPGPAPLPPRILPPGGERMLAPDVSLISGNKRATNMWRQNFNSICDGLRPIKKLYNSVDDAKFKIDNFPSVKEILDQLNSLIDEKIEYNFVEKLINNSITLKFFGNESLSGLKYSCIIQHEPQSVRGAPRPFAILNPNLSDMARRTGHNTLFTYINTARDQNIIQDIIQIPFVLQSDAIIGNNQNFDMQINQFSVVGHGVTTDMFRYLQENRRELIKLNILDMNIMPIDVNLLTREIPLTNIYNYSSSLDDFLTDYTDGRSIRGNIITTPGATMALTEPQRIRHFIDELLNNIAQGNITSVNATGFYAQFFFEPRETRLLNYIEQIRNQYNNFANKLDWMRSLLNNNPALETHLAALNANNEYVENLLSRLIRYNTFIQMVQNPYTSTSGYYQIMAPLLNYNRYFGPAAGPGGAVPLATLIARSQTFNALADRDEIDFVIYPKLMLLDYENPMENKKYKGNRIIDINHAHFLNTKSNVKSYLWSSPKTFDSFYGPFRPWLNATAQQTIAVPTFHLTTQYRAPGPGGLHLGYGTGGLPLTNNILNTRKDDYTNNTSSFYVLPAPTAAESQYFISVWPQYYPAGFQLVQSEIVSRANTDPIGRSYIVQSNDLVSPARAGVVAVDRMNWLKPMNCIDGFISNITNSPGEHNLTELQTLNTFEILERTFREGIRGNYTREITRNIDGLLRNGYNVGMNMYQRRFYKNNSAFPGAAIRPFPNCFFEPDFRYMEHLLVPHTKFCGLWTDLFQNQTIFGSRNVHNSVPQHGYYFSHRYDNLGFIVPPVPPGAPPPPPTDYDIYTLHDSFPYNIYGKLCTRYFTLTEDNARNNIIRNLCVLSRILYSEQGFSYVHTRNITFLDLMYNLLRYKITNESLYYTTKVIQGKLLYGDQYDVHPEYQRDRRILPRVPIRTNLQDR